MTDVVFFFGVENHEMPRRTYSSIKSVVSIAKALWISALLVLVAIDQNLHGSCGVEWMFSFRFVHLIFYSSWQNMSGARI